MKKTTRIEKDRNKEVHHSLGEVGQALQNVDHLKYVKLACHKNAKAT